MTDDLFKDISEYLKNPDDREGLLTEEEVQIAIVGFLEARGEEGAEENEIYNFIKWLEMVRINNTLLGLFLKGIVYLDDPKGAFDTGSDIIISLTEEGKRLKELT